MKKLVPSALLLSLIAFALQAEAGASSRGRSPWFLGIALASEAFGGDSGLGESERFSLSLVLDPFHWKTAVPSLAAGFTVPVFPWNPAETLFEARLDLRLCTLRPSIFDSLYNGPAEYAPAVGASYYSSLSGGGVLAGFTLRPLVFRTGDGVYSFFAVSTILTRGISPDAAYNFRAFSVELFEFTHFFM
jgi:hypothetical protein